jgi:septal ring factor EnvC (AmiA/AmiB activator)
MAAEYDSTEFVDTDFQTHKSPFATPASASDPLRAPTRDEVDRKVVEAQQKLAELKRAQENLERERSSLEELRRRQSEFQTGRQEMIHNLTRGLGLLEEAEFNTRREAEQMVKTIADFRDALTKIETVRDETWTKENFSTELTRALTAIENARMEWNTARLKLPALSPEALKKTEAETAPQNIAPSPLASLSFGQLCKIGLAMTWPLVLVALGALGVFIFIVVLLHR